MAFTTMAQVLTALPGQRLVFSKAIPQSFGSWASGWSSAGLPAAGANPSSGLAGNVPTSATTGALPLVNAGSGELTLARLFATIATSVGTRGMLLLYDRLWHNSGISATSTSAQTINSVALTRPDANGARVEAWWQTYAAMGAGTPSITLTYTDQDGNTGNTGSSGALSTTMAAQRTGPFALAAGDTGVRSAQTWQADATFTSGTIGLVLRRRIAEIPMTHDADVSTLDALGCALAKIDANACLEFVVWAGVTGTPTYQGEAWVIEG
jgi:hypothetical protein